MKEGCSIRIVTCDGETKTEFKHSWSTYHEIGYLLAIAAWDSERYAVRDLLYSLAWNLDRNDKSIPKEHELLERLREIVPQERTFD